MNKYHLLFAIIIALTIAACTAGNGQEIGSAPLPGDRALPTETAPAEVALQPEASQPEATAPIVETEVTAVLPVLGAAPAWSNEVWINSETPLPLEDLRGKVILLEFWTFG